MFPLWFNFIVSEKALAIPNHFSLYINFLNLWCTFSYYDNVSKVKRIGFMEKLYSVLRNTNINASVLTAVGWFLVILFDDIVLTFLSVLTLFFIFINIFMHYKY